MTRDDEDVREAALYLGRARPDPGDAFEVWLARKGGAARLLAEAAELDRCYAEAEAQAARVRAAGGVCPACGLAECECEDEGELLRRAALDRRGRP